MSDSIVRFPVVCPECGQEALTALAITFAAKAVIQGKPIRLHSNCHDKWWDASRVEIEQLREYIGALSPDVQPQSNDLPQFQLVVDNNNYHGA